MACQFSGGLHITQYFFNEKGDDARRISQAVNSTGQERVGKVA